MAKTICSSKYIILVTWPIQPITFAWQNDSTSAFASDGKIDTTLLNFGSAKKLCLVYLMRQKLCWNYFAFNQPYVAKGNIGPTILPSTNRIWLNAT